MITPIDVAGDCKGMLSLPQTPSPPVMSHRKSYHAKSGWHARGQKKQVTLDQRWMEIDFIDHQDNWKQNEVTPDWKVNVSHFSKFTEFSTDQFSDLAL